MTATNTAQPSRQQGSPAAPQTQTTAAVSPPRPAKIQAWHLDRLAIVYVRQSTPQQVGENTESAQRQYALARRAGDLGWPADRVLIIDEDQGRSATTAEGRHGFQHLMTEVGLDHVGLILGLEMSRLARDDDAWHRLLQLCAIFRTLLGDQDGLYDPTDHNDRLLLGIKGIMSAAELHVLRGRMHEGKRNKARRGELFTLPPIGYLKLPTGEFALDPDEQVQGVVRLVFDQFERLGTIRKVLRYLLAHGIRVGLRPPAGPNRGQLEWRVPTRDTIAGILSHPAYAGYYCYGRRQTDARRKKPGQPGSGRVVVPPEEYVALLPDRLPAYITKERYEAIQRRLAENRARAASKGAPREGLSLLAGLVVCAGCGRRMAVHYSGHAHKLRYVCRSDAAGCRKPRRSMAGRVLDALVAEQVLAALQPGALELSLAAADDVLRERQRLDENWRQRLERARYQAQRVERQYQATEPEHRLVARTLEQRWEEALQEVRRLEEDYARSRRQQPAALTERELEQIRALAQDLPALWQAPTTTAADRQRVIRFLVERVVVAVQGSTNQVQVTVEWAGGCTSQHDLTRPVLSYRQMVENERLLARIRQLRAEGLPFAQMAAVLNAEGFHPSKQTQQFTGDTVGLLWRRHFAPASCPGRQVAPSMLREHEWSVLDLASELQMPKNTLLAWMRRGWVRFRRLPGYRGRCLCWADAAEFVRLRKLRDTAHGWWDPPLPAELTTPKGRPEK
jgi:DNA invertase Pin-like site-specific DNA recombinase